MDVGKYLSRPGKLVRTFTFSIDEDTLSVIQALRSRGVNVAAFARDHLVPKLKELRKEIEKKVS